MWINPDRKYVSNLRIRFEAAAREEGQINRRNIEVVK